MFSVFARCVLLVFYILLCAKFSRAGVSVLFVCLRGVFLYTSGLVFSPNQNGEI